MNSNLFSLIFLLGAVQGLILALYLFFSRSDKRQAKYFLGALIFVLSYDMFETAMWVQGVALITSRIFTFSHLFTLGPSLYLTVRGSINPEKIPGKKILLLYTPALVDFLISFVIFMLSVIKPISFNTFVKINGAHVISSRLLMVVAFWIYFRYAVKDFQRFRQAAQNGMEAASESETGIVNKWIKSFLYVCLVIAVVWTLTIFGVVFFEQQEVMQFYYPLEFLLAFLTYWVGFTGYHRIKVVYLNEQKNNQIYFNKLSGDEIGAAATALSEAMTSDKIYLDPELTLTKLAAHLNLPPKTISAVLNQHLDVGFNEYVNRFRVEEVKKKLLSMDANSTILAVALDSGFNSLATFQRVFKAVTGITPKQFLAENKEKSS